MAACDWREEPDGFVYFEVDFREGDTQERTAVLRVAADEVQRRPSPAVLCHWEAGSFDTAWFKEIKDANRALRHVDLRVAFLGLGSRGGVLAGMLNLRVGHERVRHFDDESTALAWLRQEKA